LALLARVTPAKETKRSASYWQKVAAPLVAATSKHGMMSARGDGPAPPSPESADTAAATAQVSTLLASTSTVEKSK
jgi:hypothetical protein